MGKVKVTTGGITILERVTENSGVGHATDPYVTTSQEIPRSGLNTVYGAV